MHALDTLDTPTDSNQQYRTVSLTISQVVVAAAVYINNSCAWTLRWSYLNARVRFSFDAMAHVWRMRGLVVLCCEKSILLGRVISAGDSFELFCPVNWYSYKWNLAIHEVFHTSNCYHRSLVCYRDASHNNRFILWGLPRSKSTE